MLRATIKKGKVKRGPTKYGDISRHADLLGVNRTHLWRVLTGRRHSATLQRRYSELLRLLPPREK